MSFLIDLNDFDLIEIRTIDHSQYVHKDDVAYIEKMIRMHHELDINMEGIDTVSNVLKKIEILQEELITTKNKLRLYEK
jgi:uncharacterized protein (DUF305 family)